MLYRVRLAGRQKAQTVDADYFRIDGGVLTFRNANPQQGYPMFVKAFAAGVWTMIENIDTREGLAPVSRSCRAGGESY